MSAAALQMVKEMTNNKTNTVNIMICKDDLRSDRSWCNAIEIELIDLIQMMASYLCLPVLV